MNAVTRTGDGLDNALVTFNEQLGTRKKELEKVLPSHISPERFQRTILTVATVNPDLLRADRRSLLTACMKAAQDGLLPDGREAAIVVFENSKQIDGQWAKVKEAQYMPMVYGLRKKVLQSGEVASLSTQVVYKCEVDEGRFIYEEGTDAMLRHKPKLEMTEEEAADENVIAAYSMVTFKDGTKSYEVLPRRELNKIQRASKTGSPVDHRGNRREVKGPWKDWYTEMCRKSALRRHSKTLPMSGDILDALNTGFDDDGAGESVAQTFASAEPSQPIRIPSNAEIDAASHDPETGEVVDEDEERRIAEELDRQSEHGDEPAEEEPETQEEVDWTSTEASIIASLTEKTTIIDVNSYWSSPAVEAILEQAPPDIVGKLEAEKRKRITELKNGK